MKITARPLDVPLKKPFGISGGTQVHARNVLVEIEIDGVRGWGEGAPFPAFNGETQEAALASCARVIPEIEGVSDDLVLRERIAGHCSPSARCAIETALFDVRARRAGRSLHAIFGGAENVLVTDVTITTGTVEDATREARELKAFSTLKIKVGGTNVEQDIARVLAVRSARPKAKLLVDANAGFTLEEALHFATETRSAQISLFEQPCREWDAVAEVKAKTGLMVAIDESVTCVADVERAKGIVDAVNLKIMKSGIFEGLEIVAAARKNGLIRMIGGMVETRLAMGMSACIAGGIGDFSFVDLDTPLFLVSDPFVGGYRQDGERLDLSSISLGHGLAPREEPA